MSVLARLLGTLSGNRGLRISEQLLFDKVIGFKSIVNGAGASTILSNVAVALSEKTSYTVCVLDTNFMFPTQYATLVGGEEKGVTDMLSFIDDIASIAVQTKYKNVYLVSLINRNIVDMLSSKDNEVLVDKVIGALKSYFDIVLVDLSSETTNINTYAAIKCNKVITVADTSLKCMIYLKKSYNHMVSLGVNFAKCNKVILNKQVEDMVLGAESALTGANLKVVGVIPLSYEIARLGVAGKQIWGTAAKDKGVLGFNSVVDLVVDEIIQKTPLNDKYVNLKVDYTKHIAGKQGKSVVDKKKELLVSGVDDDDTDLVIVEQ